MKKTLFAIAIAVAGLTGATASFAQDANTTVQTGWYASADAGYSSVDKGPYNNGNTTGGITGGYRFAINPQTALGVEVGYQYLGIISARGASNDSSLSSKLHGPTAGLNLRYNFSPNWYGEIRGGGFFSQAQGLTDEANPVYKRVDRTTYYAGVGVGYNITPQWSLGLNYNYYNGTGHGLQLNTNAYTVSAEYRF